MHKLFIELQTKIYFRCESNAKRSSLKKKKKQNDDKNAEGSAANASAYWRPLQIASLMWSL